MHCDEYIDKFNTDAYVSWFLMLHRLPAVLKFKFSSHIKAYELYCTYQGNYYRVTGCSRLGDIYLAQDLTRTVGYDLRVDVSDCTDFKPGIKHKDITCMGFVIAYGNCPSEWRVKPEDLE